MGCEQKSIRPLRRFETVYRAAEEDQHYYPAGGFGLEHGLRKFKTNTHERRVGIRIVGRDFILRANFQSASCNVAEKPRRGRLETGPAGWNPALPVCSKDVEFVALFGVVVGTEYERLAIRRKFGERCESAEMRDLFQPRPIQIDCEQLEMAAVALILVGRENDLTPGPGVNDGREAGTAVIGNLPGVLSRRRPPTMISIFMGAVRLSASSSL